MGKPSDAAGNGSKSTPTSDALSLHSNPGQSYRDAYRDDDFDDDDDDDEEYHDAPQIAIDDMPPSYGDALLDPTASDDPSAPLVAPSSISEQPSLPTTTDSGAPDIRWFREDAGTGARYYVTRFLEDPQRLERHMRALAATPPRPYVRLTGTHTESTRDRKGKTETSTVTDFDVRVELTPFLYADAQHRKSWARLRTVANGEKARRGTVFARRAPGYKSGARDLEVGADSGPPEPTLREWCHRYAASHAGLKCFALKRRMVGFDEAGVVARLRQLVAATNYRGRLAVEVGARDELVECYNEARLNRWRFTPWAWWLAVLSLLFLLTWPYLWLRTKRWEVAVVEWPFSRPTPDGRLEYVSVSEEQWYNLWAPAIAKAVLGKRQALLDQEDLRRSREPPPPLQTGHAGADQAAELFRAGLSAMNEVNRQLGWGEDR